MMTTSHSSSVLVFKPRRSLGWLSLVLIALPVAGVALATVLGTGGQGPLPLFLISVALPLAIALAFLLLAVWFPTIRYELDDEALVLRCGPVLHYRIPLAEVQSVRRRNLVITLWSSVRLPGLALFSVPYGDVGTVKMCATAAARDILLIETERGKYGVTPADEAGFVAALRSRLGR